MSSTEQKLQYTFEEYLALEEKADYRSEYFKGEVFAMAGGTDEHSRIIQNVNREVGNAIFDKDCSVFGGELKIRIEASDVAVYPDGQVICDPIQYYNDRRDIITNPILVVEVLSEGTALYDRTGKFRHYQRIPSLKEFVLIEQKESQIDVFRKNNNGLWELEGYEGLDTTIELKSLGVTLSAKKIYHRVQFPE